jgi:hypothetical protein
MDHCRYFIDHDPALRQETGTLCHPIVVFRPDEQPMLMPNSLIGVGC